MSEENSSDDRGTKCPERFCKAIKEVRETRGLSPEEMGFVIGCSRAEIYRWEKCQEEPKKIDMPDHLMVIDTMMNAIKREDERRRRRMTEEERTKERARVSRAFACDTMKKHGLDPDSLLRSDGGP